MRTDQEPLEINPLLPEPMLFSLVLLLLPAVAAEASESALLILSPLLPARVLVAVFENL